jgi:hypothetical protein
MPAQCLFMSVTLFPTWGEEPGFCWNNESKLPCSRVNPLQRILWSWSWDFRSTGHHSNQWTVWALMRLYCVHCSLISKYCFSLISLLPSYCPDWFDCFAFCSQVTSTVGTIFPKSCQLSIPSYFWWCIFCLYSLISVQSRFLFGTYVKQPCYPLSYKRITIHIRSCSSFLLWICKQVLVILQAGSKINHI